MIQTYKPGQTVKINFQFFDNQQVPVKMDNDLVLLNIGEEGRHSWYLKDAPMTYNPQTYFYEYVVVVPEHTPFGLYPMSATWTILTVPQTQTRDIRIWGGYITVEELKHTSVWFDFSKYSDEELEELTTLAKDMIDAYCDYERWVEIITQKWETIVDNLGRIYLRFKRKPVISVNYLRVRVPASTSIVLFTRYLDLFPDQWYAYYPISTAYWASAVGTYPLLVLGTMDKLLYVVDYKVDPFVPPMVKRASAIICANFLKSDFYRTQTWMPWTVWPVNIFKSGAYYVGFDTKSLYKTWKWYWGGQFLTPDVQEILDRYKYMKNNSIF